MNLWPFRIDEKSSSEGSLFVDVAGMGEVVISVSQSGISIAVYPIRADGGEDPVAEVDVSTADLNPPTKD
jgi:hypothetical protein